MSYLEGPKILSDFDWGYIPNLDCHQIEQPTLDSSWLDRVAPINSTSQSQTRKLACIVKKLSETRPIRAKMDL
jgi:hypothetical protein